LKINAKHSIALILGLESPEGFNYLILNRYQILELLPKIYHRYNPGRGESVSIILEAIEDPSEVNILLRGGGRQRAKVNNWEDLEAECEIKP